MREKFKVKAMNEGRGEAGIEWNFGFYGRFNFV
jgi:hypothetical protein